ncbi:hypothetical protein Y032_0689g1559 [Ancylostoma ceylanicum]|uniref:Uncharacterized protein n=1 Tax=Ancylostoma ceylanicum TaxID=53326 RepID=A0A016WGV7_9BILA|nr:hypothetical protein Y032_0689g1559 [Ancylostoma ceylanicum]
MSWDDPLLSSGEESSSDDALLTPALTILQHGNATKLTLHEFFCSRLDQRSLAAMKEGLLRALLQRAAFHKEEQKHMEE